MLLKQRINADFMEALKNKQTDKKKRPRFAEAAKPFNPLSFMLLFFVQQH